MSDEPPKKRSKNDEEKDEEESALVDPCTIDRFCDTMINLFLKTQDVKGMKLSHVFRAKAVNEGTDIQEFNEENNISLADIQHAVSVYYKKASQTNVVTAESAFTVVKAYVNSGESIDMHPRFPKTPLSAYNLYLTEQGIGKFDKNDEVRNQFSQNQKLKQKYEVLYKRKLQEHVEELKQFLNTETDLKDEHTKHIMNRIRSYERKVDPDSVPRGKRGPTKKKAQPKTAFDYFKLSKKDSYTDLEEDAREKKLLKRFNKLPDEMRAIFENLAKAS